MHLERDYPCNACNYVLSHPVDYCPLCNAQFYWRIIPSRDLAETETDTYVACMFELVEGQTTRQFLVHGHRLWLPHKFWGCCPDGSVLNQFPWIAQLKLMQHQAKRTEGKQALETFAESVDDSSPWDTHPSLSNDGDGFRPQSQPSTTPPEAAPSTTAHQARTANTRKNPAPSARVSVSSKSIRENGSNKPKRPREEWFLPVLLTLFFLLLALSWLMLVFHKNTRTTLTQPNSEVLIDERSLLS